MLSELRMGRSYEYECPKCGYKARVSGRADTGAMVAVQTVFCRDCREIRDAVIRVKVVESFNAWSENTLLSLRKGPGKNSKATSALAPRLESVLNRLPIFRALGANWEDFKPGCPVSPHHRVQVWNDPGKCPRCGIFLERGALPYRIWE